MATTQHHFHVRSDHVGIARRPVRFIAVAAGVTLTLAFAVVAVSSIGGSRESTAVEVVEPTGLDQFDVGEPVSALLDGPAFAEAVDRAVADLRAGRSILLDGEAFALAVNEAVAFATNGSALLDGPDFADAVTDAVSAISG